MAFFNPCFGLVHKKRGVRYKECALIKRGSTVVLKLRVSHFICEKGKIQYKNYVGLYAVRIKEK